MKRLKFILGVVLGMSALLLSPRPAVGTDIPIFPTGPVYRLSNLVWGTSTQPGFNNNYFFTPLNLNESVCVYVKNNNTTNPHTFTASITVNSDPSNTTPSDGTWQAGANSTGLFAATSPGLPAGIGVSISGVSQVSVNFSASSTQAGSPETATVSIIQTQGNCFSGNQFIGSAPQTVSATIPLQTVSDGLSQAFFAAVSVVNPAITPAPVFNLNANNGARTVYLDSSTVSCTAACSAEIQITTNSGTTCAVSTIGNARIGSSITSTALATTVSCVANPGVGSLVLTFNLAASTPLIVDLKGVILAPNTTNGVMVTMQAALTGTINASFKWYEK